jgi:hypothetical protein
MDWTCSLDERETITEFCGEVYWDVLEDVGDDGRKYKIRSGGHAS